jgi:ATP-dependent exoDNAse (exonuclease V) beta subunit
MEAMQQFIPELKQHNVEPTKWITELGHVHRMLALGTPAQKLQTLQTVLRAYGVPVQALFDQNAQQQYLQQGQFQQPLQMPQQQQPLTREEAQKLWTEQFVQTEADRDLQRFAADAEKHPHYEELRETMSGLLQANLAEDLESAYQAALRHPRHSALWDEIQQQDRAAQEEQRKAAEAQRVLKAKGKAVSPQSATPSGLGSEDKPKGLRSSIESAFEAHAGGRV